MASNEKVLGLLLYDDEPTSSRALPRGRQLSSCHSNSRLRAVRSERPSKPCCILPKPLFPGVLFCDGDEPTILLDYAAFWTWAARIKDSFTSPGGFWVVGGPRNQYRRTRPDGLRLTLRDIQLFPWCILTTLLWASADKHLYSVGSIFAWQFGQFAVSQIWMAFSTACQLYFIFFVLHPAGAHARTPQNRLTHLVVKTSAGIALLYMWRAWGVIEIGVSVCAGSTRILLSIFAHAAFSSRYPTTGALRGPRSLAGTSTRP